MNRPIIRAAGIVLILGGVFGFLISILGLVMIWTNVPETSASLRSGLDLLDSSIQAGTNGLGIIQTSLAQTRADLGLMKTTLDESAGMLESIQGMSADSADLIGSDFSTVLENTRTSLNSAATSARLVDDTLGVITSLPILRDRYHPDVPLNQAITNVSKSLEALPDSLKQISATLDQTAQDLDTVRANFDALSASLTGIDENLADAQSVVSEYQRIASELQHTTDRLRAGLDGWLRLLTLAISVLFLWMFLASAGLILQGIDYAGRKIQPRQA